MSAYEKAARAAELQKAIKYHALGISPAIVRPPEDQVESASREITLRVYVDHASYKVTRPTAREMDVLQEALRVVLYTLRDKIAVGVRAEMQGRLETLCAKARDEAGIVLALSKEAGL